MSTHPPKRMEPQQAAATIDSVERHVGKQQQEYMGSIIAFGGITIAFFAFAGWVSKGFLESIDPLPAFLPVLLCYCVIYYRNKSNRSRRVLYLENKLAGAYIIAVTAAIAIDVFLLKQGTLLAGLTGLLPAAVCFYAAWRLSRK